jgi:hypothetical protein
MREIIDHIVQETGDLLQLNVLAVDNPQTGPNQAYAITGCDLGKNPSASEMSSFCEEVKIRTSRSSHGLLFQNGVDEINGLTDEILLAVLIDRLRRLPGESGERMQALIHIEDALRLLKKRSKDSITKSLEEQMSGR